ncbi:hypothetical protein [Streptomyces sp. NPDC012888]|uniref:hypothetical protein n=1 Tax=Streptomyces sp. NPDC012888 TaxID=3364855 RepID=UPI0036A433D1
MAERLAFILDGDDNLSPVFRRIGESAERFHRRLNAAVDESGGELRAFTRGADGQLQQLAGSMASAGQAAEQMGQDAAQSAHQVQAVGTAAAEANTEVEQFTRDSRGRLHDVRGRFVSAARAAEQLARATAEASPEVEAVGASAEGASSRTRRMADSSDAATPSILRLGGAAGGAAAQVGGKGSGLGGALGAVAAIAGLSLLPSLGALVPMVAGLGLAVGTLKMGFSGVGEAVAAAGKGKKEYAEALKGLTPQARAFTKQLVATKKSFEGLGDRIQKVMLPGFTQALKQSGPLVKILGDTMVVLGKGFGDAAAGLGRLMKDSGFQKDFARILQLGTVFVRDMTSGLGGLARGFLTFGAASGPTLTALSGGLRDLLGKGLPGMFQGLERGISGSAQFLSGFFGMLNSVLPAIGRFAGEVARTFGPYLSAQVTFFGKVFTSVLDAISAGVRLAAPIFRDLVFGVKAISMAISFVAPAFRAAGAAIVAAFVPALGGIRNAQGPLQRLKGWVEDNKLGFMELGRMAASAMMGITQAVVTALPIAVQGFRYLSMIVLGAFQGILNGAATAFGWIPGIGPKLKGAAAEFDRFKGGFINGLQAAENKTRSFSNSVAPRLRENRLQMNIGQWESQIRVAKGQLSSVPPSKRAQLLAHIGDLERKAARARAELASIRGKTVTVTIVSRNLVDSSLNRSRIVNGRLVRATGGIVRGPGTSTSDSIPAWLSDGEYVIRASSVSRLGLPFLNALNEGRMPTSAATPAPTRAAAMPAAPAARGVTFAPQITVTGAIDPISTAQQLRRLLLKLQRNYGLSTGVIMS